jgi:hypothetical protein
MKRHVATLLIAIGFITVTTQSQIQNARVRFPL